MKRTTLRQYLLHATLATTLSTAFALASACEYYADDFQIIHPESLPAVSGASSVPIFMEFIQIEASDRLLGASTPVADSVVLSQPGAQSSRAGAEPGIVLEPGHDVTLTQASAHLVMRGVNTQLHEGRQYPLTLIFEEAGTVDVEFIVGGH